jgi:hypothetical protein
MLLEYIPRARLLESLEAGWTLVPGHSYLASDWAIIMAAPIEGTVPQCDAAAILRYFNAKRPPLAHNQRWCRSGHAVLRGVRECKVCRHGRDRARYLASKVAA